MNKKTGLFIMPRSSRDWRGAEALWITVAGWAAAAERKFGEAYVLTTDRVATPTEVLDYPLGKIPENAKTKRKWSSLLPTTFTTLIKDVLLWRSSVIANRYGYNISDIENDVVLVWEQHDLFPGPGAILAKMFKVPLVIKLDGPVVWEAKKWGVKRLFYGKLLEKYVEIPALKNADLIACVSQEVYDTCLNMGIPKSKLHISPMAVDPGLFNLNKSNEELKNDLGLSNELVIGWTGSFRSFHGLDHVIRAFNIVHANFKNTRLLLVGDGAEKDKIEKIIDQLALNNKVIFAGRQRFIDMPRYVSLFDIALVSARSSIGFHYSPLKLREYMGAGIASIAPRAGELPVVFDENTHLLLYEAGNAEDMAERILDLVKNVELREEVAIKGQKFILENGTWDIELEKLLKKLINKSK